MELPGRKLVVLDIGCRWGFAQRFLEGTQDYRIFGFDPDEAECQRLRERYAGQPVTLVPLGLAGTSGKRTLHLTEEPACSSLLPPDSTLTDHYPALKCARKVSSTIVNTTTLDAWAQEAGVSAVDYLKIDTQGTELEILQGGQTTLQQVRCLEVEVEFNPIYLGQPVFSDVDLYLRRQGFMLWKFSNQVHYSSDGQPEPLAQEDAIYYDDAQRVAHPVFGGQLYWANAHYVRREVLNLEPNETQRRLDTKLFETLGMPDVVKHLRQR